VAACPKLFAADGELHKVVPGVVKKISVGLPNDVSCHGAVEVDDLGIDRRGLLSAGDELLADVEQRVTAVGLIDRVVLRETPCDAPSPLTSSASSQGCGPV
jgi:hypothetical protein